MGLKGSSGDSYIQRQIQAIPYPFKALNPVTIRRYLNNIRAYFEEVGEFEISDRRISKRVKIPKASKVDLEPIDVEELRMLCEWPHLKTRPYT